MGGGSKIVQNCVTSFMDTPFYLLLVWKPFEAEQDKIFGCWCTSWLRSWWRWCCEPSWACSRRRQSSSRPSLSRNNRWWRWKCVYKYFQNIFLQFSNVIRSHDPQNGYYFSSLYISVSQPTGRASWLTELTKRLIVIIIVNFVIAKINGN